VPALAIAVGAASSVLIAHLAPPPARTPLLPTQTEPNLPLPRSSAAMAYDPATRTTLLFGGDYAGHRLDDTWSWSGSRWTQLHPPASPPGLTAPQMAYDPRSEAVVLIGGSAGSATSSAPSTWTWDGSTWRPEPGSGLQGPVDAALATDAAAGQVILVSAESGTRGIGTWVWSGRHWSLLHPPTSPPQAGLLAYDEASGRLLMVTGPDATSLGSSGGDVWSWDGTTWSPVGGPAAAVPTDGEHRPDVLAPSADGPLLLTSSDMYLWDADRWVNQGLTPDPRRIAEAVAYDAAAQEVVLFGGNCLTCLGLPLVELDDTWTWDGRWAPRAGAIPPTPVIAT